MPSAFDSTPDDVRELLRAAAEEAAAYYRRIAELPIMPDVTAASVRGCVDASLPIAGSPAAELLRMFSDALVPLSRHNGHPRFFGYVASPGTAIAAAGDLLAAILNANVTAWRSAPAAVALEQIVTGWLRQIVGFPPGSLGLLVSGGSIANLCGLAAARATVLPASGRSGLSGTRVARVYTSTESHFSIAKAASILGLGDENVVAVPVNDRQEIDCTRLDEAIGRDSAAGMVPVAIVGNAGTTATGAIDALDELRVVASRRNLWFHVDGAYGAFAALVPGLRQAFEGMDEADSLSLDPHKWLYSSMGCGCVLYRDPSTARAAFAHQAEYTRTVGHNEDEAFAYWDYGPELSRPFRALPIWFMMRSAGTAALVEAIEGNIRCAKYLERLVHESEDLEMLAPVRLSIFCFRYVPRPGVPDLDAVNERILVELRRGGNSYLSNARVGGRFALRGCVLNYRTTERDMQILLEDVRRAARRVLAS